MPGVEQIQAILNLGAGGLLTLAVIAFATGRVRVGALVDRDVDERERRAASLLLAASAREDQWRAMALDLVDKVEGLTNAVETAMSIKVPK